ncbi:MAG: hypothetical protein V3T22_06670 [Planctomycetota bacterium]
MSATQKQRATTRPAIPWLSLCAALALVGVLVLLQERSRGNGSQGSRTPSSYAPALRQALFGGGGTDRQGALAHSAGAPSAPSAEDAAGDGSDPAVVPALAAEAAPSVPSGSLDGGESQAVPAITPASVPGSVPAARPVH